MKFRARTVRALAEMIAGDVPHFPYRSSGRISEFFADCDLPYMHDGTTRWRWTADRLDELLADPAPAPGTLPTRVARVIRVLLDKGDALPDDADRSKAVGAVNVALTREGFEAFYDAQGRAHVRHIGSGTLSETTNPHRPFTSEEVERRERLNAYLNTCSEDELIEEVLLPMFRQLGFHRITAAGHRDKQLEYGKDVWMRYTLPTQHVLYFGLQAKRGKLDAAGASKGDSRNVAEIHNQAVMMLGHEIFDPELSRRVLVDHALIVAGGEITKAARNWIGEKLDQTRRSQIMFMDREDILNLVIVSNIPLPAKARPSRSADDIGEVPF